MKVLSPLFGKPLEEVTIEDVIRTDYFIRELRFIRSHIRNREADRLDVKELRDEYRNALNKESTRSASFRKYVLYVGNMAFKNVMRMAIKKRKHGTNSADRNNDQQR